MPHIACELSAGVAYPARRKEHLKTAFSSPVAAAWPWGTDGVFADSVDLDAIASEVRRGRAQPAHLIVWHHKARFRHLYFSMRRFATTRELRRGPRRLPTARDPNHRARKGARRPKPPRGLLLSERERGRRLRRPEVRRCRRRGARRRSSGIWTSAADARALRLGLRTMHGTPPDTAEGAGPMPSLPLSSRRAAVS